MRYTDILTETVKIYYHGSYDALPVGTILKPKENYTDTWGEEDFYILLEKYRPSHMLAHNKAVFMCDNEQDVDNAGGGTDWLFKVVPLGIVERHDMAWSSEIVIATENKDHEWVIEIAQNYWSGIPTSDPVWEYLTTSAKIIHVEEY